MKPGGGQESGLNLEVPPPPPEAGIVPCLLPAAAARGASATCGPPGGGARDSGKVGRLWGFSPRKVPGAPERYWKQPLSLKFSSTSRFSQVLFPHLTLSSINPPPPPHEYLLSTYYGIQGFGGTEGTEQVNLPALLELTIGGEDRRGRGQQRMRSLLVKCFKGGSKHRVVTSGCGGGACSG